MPLGNCRRYALVLEGCETRNRRNPCTNSIGYDEAGIPLCNIRPRIWRWRFLPLVTQQAEISFKSCADILWNDTERAAKDVFKSSDGIIAQYAGAFQQLKEQFDARSRLSALKVLRDLRQGVVELSDILDDMRDMGEHLISEGKHDEH